MKPIRIAGRLLLGAALTAGCIERNTEPTDPATGPFSADVAAAKTSAVNDNRDDWVGKAGQEYQDIAKCEITKQGGNFVFVMTMWATVPGEPLVPSWADAVDWGIAIDRDPTSPTGYPFTKNGAAPWEYFVEHRAYRSGFTDPFDRSDGGGILTDRLKGEALTVPLSIKDRTLTWVVDAALLGDPLTFQWACFTTAAHAGDDVKNGYNNIEIFDQAPNISSGAPNATWPQ